jgi:hypothetical protein
MEELKLEVEGALADMETALYEARPDAKERMHPRAVGGAVRNAGEVLGRAGLAYDHDLFEMVARRWEKGYPVDEEYEADVRDLQAEATRAVDQLRTR